MSDREVSGIKSKVSISLGDIEKGRKSLDNLHETARRSGPGTATHLGNIEQASKHLAEHLGELGNLGGIAGKGLEAIEKSGGSLLSALGGAAGGGVIGAAAAAGTALMAFGAESVHVFTESAESVLNFQRRTGESAESSSRLVGAFKEVGIEGETASAAMVKLTKSLEKNPEALAKFGVEVARNDKGGIDFNETLMRMADAYVGASNASDRTAMALAAFGKNGAALIPILEQGRVGIQQLESQVNTVFNQEQLEQAHRYEMEVRQMNDAWRSFSADVGSKVVPVLTGTMENLQANSAGLKAFFGTLASGNVTLVQAYQANVNADAAYRKNAEALLKVKDAQAEAAAKAKEFAQAQDDAEQAVTDLTRSLHAEHQATMGLVQAEDAVTQSGINLERQQLRQKEVQITLQDAQTKLNDAIRIYGPKSEQAAKAADALATAQLDVKEASLQLKEAQQGQGDAIEKAADAARKQAQAQADVTDKTDLGAIGAREYIKKLDELTKALPADSPLRASLGKIRNDEQLIVDKADEVMNHILALNGTRASVSLDFVQPNSERGGPVLDVPGRAGGGPVIPNSSYVVGERGPEVFVPDVSGQIIPNHSLNSFGGGGEVNVTINNQGLSALDPHQIARDVVWAMRTM